MLISITEDRVTVDYHELGEILTFAKNYLSSDNRVLVIPGESGKPVYFFSAKSI